MMEINLSPCCFRRRLHGSVKAGEGPVGDVGNPPMFQRIEMDVVKVVPVVALVTNQVFPIAPLPDPALAAGALSCRRYLGLWQATGESELDDLPAQGEVSVASR